MQSQTFTVAGITCSDCARRVEASVKQVDGVQDCQVDPLSGQLTVWLADPEVSAEPIARAVGTAGYTLMREHDVQHRSMQGFARFVLSKRETILTVIAAALTLAGLALTVAAAPLWSRAPLFAAAIVVGGVPVARHAIQEVLLSRRVGINTLMVIAVIGATFIGEWVEAAVVVVLFSLGEALEGYAADQARRTLDSLLDLAPPVARKLVPTGEIQEIQVEHLAAGDRVLVRPGDRVSADGIVCAGQSAVDQAPITGESVPVEKEPGDEVFAGTINITGALEIEVNRVAADNTLSRMVALVQEAQARQAPVQRFIDRFARVYTPVVAGAAVLIATVPPLLFGEPFLGEQG